MSSPGPLPLATPITDPTFLSLQARDGHRLYSRGSAGSLLTDTPDSSGGQHLSMEPWTGNSDTTKVQRWRFNTSNTHLHRNDLRYSGPETDGKLAISCSDNSFAGYNDPNTTSYYPGTINGTTKFICGGPSGQPNYPSRDTDDLSATCQWITDTQVLRCCTTPNSKKTSAELDICRDGYDPSNPDSFCKTYMSDWCKGNWGQTRSIKDNGFDLVENNTFCVPFIEDIKNSKDAVHDTVQNYYNNSGFDPTNPFWTTYAPEMCKSQPGACDDTLSDLCTSYTPRDVVEADVIQKLCGCFLPDKYYSTPKLASGHPGRGCAPMCVFPDAIQGAEDTCDNANICIMDDITIDLIKSKGKDITFDTVCGTSHTPKRLCYFANIDIEDNQSSLDAIDYQNNCSNCYTFDPSNPDVLPVAVDCKSGKPPNPGPPGPGPGPGPKPGGGKPPKWEWFAIGGGSVAIILITVIVCVLIWWFVYRTPSSGGSSSSRSVSSGGKTPVRSF